jgi:hypothetical protein
MAERSKNISSSTTRPIMPQTALNSYWKVFRPGIIKMAVILLSAKLLSMADWRAQISRLNAPNNANLEY